MLRIIFLNTWGGCLWDEGLKQFYENERGQTDIFCLQEVNRCTDGAGHRVNVTSGIIPPRPLHVDQFGALLRVLNGHYGSYAAHFGRALHDRNPIDRDVEYGNAIFVRRSLQVAGFRSGMIYRKFGHLNDGLPAARSMQAAIIVKDKTAYIVAHFHGLWNGNGKDDCHERQVQTVRVNRFLYEVSKQCREDTGLEPRVILGGDFNLTTNTKAFQGLMTGPAFTDRAVNLNARFDINDTRTSYYPDHKPTREADFVLTSSNVYPHSFEALAEPEVSDHRPLILECE